MGSNMCGYICFAKYALTSIPLYKMFGFIPKYSEKTFHSSPEKMSYGVSFVSSYSDLYPAIPVITLYVILCYETLL